MDKTKKTWCMHTTEYCVPSKKSDITPFSATWMDLEITKLSEVIQTKTNILRHHLYVESKKNYTNELIYNAKQTFTDIENKLMAFKENSGEWW